MKWLLVSSALMLFPAATGEQKLDLARRVGDEISQAQYEGEMAEVRAALARGWELALE